MENNEGNTTRHLLEALGTPPEKRRQPLHRPGLDPSDIVDGEIAKMRECGVSDPIFIVCRRLFNSHVVVRGTGVDHVEFWTERPIEAPLNRVNHCLKVGALTRLCPCTYYPGHLL